MGSMNSNPTGLKAYILKCSEFLAAPNLGYGLDLISPGELGVLMLRRATSRMGTSSLKSLLLFLPSS